MLPDTPDGSLNRMERKMSNKQNDMNMKPIGGEQGLRLYQRLAKTLYAEIVGGRYAIGDRLPAERELSIEHGISRPAVREALIALEVQGLIEVRVGSGAYIINIPGRRDQPAFAISAFEIVEARIVFESESAALAAGHITDEELAELDQLVLEIARENLDIDVTEIADFAFHITIAKASRNAAIVQTVEQLWQLRSTSPESALLHRKARSAKVRPIVAEHEAIVHALRSRDATAARNAMRAHLSAVMDHLLFASEERAVAEARRAMQNARERYAVAP